jgi:hypothetical protein
LIDEMYPPTVAEAVRKAGHDVTSILENPSTRGISDDAVYALAVSQNRAVVTENAADFLTILRQEVAAGKAAASLVVTTNRAFLRHSRAFIGRTARVLAQFCESQPHDDEQSGAVYWLQPSG